MSPPLCATPGLFPLNPVVTGSDTAPVNQNILQLWATTEMEQKSPPRPLKELKQLQRVHHTRGLV